MNNIYSTITKLTLTAIVLLAGISTSEASSKPQWGESSEVETADAATQTVAPTIALTAAERELADRQEIQATLYGMLVQGNLTEIHKIQDHAADQIVAANARTDAANLLVETLQAMLEKERAQRDADFAALIASTEQVRAEQKLIVTALQEELEHHLAPVAYTMQVEL